jgi:folate-dependent tRNA-U54 methylase TrmFO/GidA
MQEGLNKHASIHFLDKTETIHKNEVNNYFQCSSSLYDNGLKPYVSPPITEDEYSCHYQWLLKFIYNMKML